MFYAILVSLIIVMFLLVLYSLRAAKNAFSSEKSVKIYRNTLLCCVSVIVVFFLLEFADRLGYKLITFIAVDRVAVLGWMLVSLPLLIVLLLSIPVEIIEFFLKKRLRIIRKCILGLSALFLCYISYSFVQPNTKFQTRVVNLKINNLPKELKGFKILQISDIHLGNFTEREKSALIDVLVPQCNELGADIIALTGDLVTSKPDEIIGNEEFLLNLKANYGKFFIFGNHDIGMYNHGLTLEQKQQDINKIKAIMSECGFTTLSDSIANVKGLKVLGVDEITKDDYVLRYNKLTNTLSSKDVVVALSHNPMCFSMILDEDFVPQLTLAGHTHASQFEVFGMSLSDMLFKYARGLYKEGDNYIYVNRGIGYHFFRRIGSKPEITLFELD